MYVCTIVLLRSKRSKCLVRVGLLHVIYSFWNIRSNDTLRMSHTLIGTSETECLECSNAIEKKHGRMFAFYPGLPQF